MSPGPTFGPYPTSGVLGSGGMGVVYLAWDPKLGRELAIKTLSAGRAADETQRRRFKREARALAELSHPGLVSIVDAGVQDGVPWLAMPRVPGQSLESLIRARGGFSSEEACALGIQLCSALTVAHSRGILHRDLKPENVLVTPDERYVITDFGLTKDLAGEVSGDLSQTGALIGTPGYWAPEQAMGQSGQATPATDVYGLGAVLYAALTGVPPISAPSLLEAVVATKERRPTPPSALASVTPDLEAIVLKCLEKSPEDRYDSVDILEEALRELSREKARRTGGSRLFLVAGALGAFLSGVAGVWFATAPTPLERPLASARPSPEVSVAEAPSAKPQASAPPGLAQDVEARVRAAIATRAWEQGHQALAESADLHEVWLRYLLLRAEVEREGEASSTWRRRKERADVLAGLAAAGADSTPNSTWGRGLQALTGLLKDPFLAPTPEIFARHVGWEVALERALAEGPRDPERALALHQGLASLAIQRLTRGSAEPVVARARARISAWETAGGARWKVLFYGARLELIAGKYPRVFVSAVDEVVAEAVRTQRPWLLSAANYFRGEMTLGFARTDSNPLWRSLAGDLACSPVLRGHSGNRLGALLLEAGQPIEALRVLSQAPTLPEGYDDGVRYHRVLLTARALLRTRRPEAALEGLARMPARGRSTTQHQLLRALALAHLGELEQSRAAAKRLGPGDVQRDRILMVELTALTAKSAEVEGLLRGVLKGASRLEVLLCADHLERLAAAPGIKGRRLVSDPDPLVRLVAALRKKHHASIEDLVSKHLEQGLWELAARRVEQALGGKRARPELRARLEFRILSRALEEVRPTSERYQLLFKRSLALASRKLDRTQPHHLALVSALLSLGEEPWRGSVPELQKGINLRPGWSELYEGLDRVFRARRALPDAHRTLAFSALHNVRKWLEAHPKDTQAALARAYWSPPAIAEKILKRGGTVKEARVLAKLERARLDAWSLSPKVGSASLSFIGHSRNFLTRSRAEVFLEAAEARLRVLGEEQKALLVLDLLRSWCGEELGEPARYHLLRARALLGLGREREALRSAQQALASSKGLGPELRGRILAALGQCELAGGLSKSARLRLNAAIKLAPCFEVWLAAARSGKGAQAEAAYGEALSHLQHVGQIKPLWDEVISAGLSASRVGELALRHFEGRAPSFLRVLVTQALFERLGDPASARNFCRAAIQFSVQGGGALEERTSALLPRALALLPPELRAFVDAIEEVLIKTTVWVGERSAQHRADFSGALDDLARAASRVDAQAANDFWLPAVFESCGGVFLKSAPPEEAERARRRELEAARAARGAKEPSLRLELWIARLEASLRDPQALESLDRALAAAEGYSELRPLVQLEQGLLLRRLGRDEEALAAYDDLVYGSKEVRWKVLGLSLKAQILRHQGAKGRQEQGLVLNRAQCFGALGVPSNVMALHLLALAQAHLDLSDLELARRALAVVDREFKRASSLALFSERWLLGATLARLSGDPAKALELVNRAAQGREAASGVRRERALVLRDLGRRSEAIEFLSHELEVRKTIWPSEREDLEELVKELATER